MIALLAALALQGAPAAPVADTVPVVTLAEALRRAAGVDPDYVRALGQVDQADWGRRAALLSLVVPSLTTQVDATKFSTEFFNIGIGQPTSSAVNFRANASLELLSVRKFADLAFTRAEQEAAAQDARRQRFLLALAVETDYLDALTAAELLRVAESRERRALEQLEVARARVLSGAAVQTDSLQLVVEAAQAELGVLRQRAALDVARLQLGRRVGAEGPVAPAPVDSALPPPLPATADALAAAAVADAPQYRRARALERSAAASLRSVRGQYLPTVTLGGSYTRFDDSFFPEARTVSSVALTVSLPIWNQGQREAQVVQARVNRDVARAVRADLERGARRDVTQAAEAYRIGREAVTLAERQLDASRETFRVQDLRYRAGANTILDVLEAQFQLTRTEAEVVQARYALRLARAGLEATLGQRLFTE